MDLKMKMKSISLILAVALTSSVSAKAEKTYRLKFELAIPSIKVSAEKIGAAVLIPVDPITGEFGQATSPYDAQTILNNSCGLVVDYYNESNHYDVKTNMRKLSNVVFGTEKFQLAQVTMASGFKGDGTDISYFFQFNINPDCGSGICTKYYGIDGKTVNQVGPVKLFAIICKGTNPKDNHFDAIIKRDLGTLVETVN